VHVYVVELSEVLWHFFVQMPMSMHGTDKIRWILVFCAWAIWAVLTVAILLLMEGLSAFLHTLRLHWSVNVMPPFFAGIFGGRIEILSTHNVLCRKFAADCRKMATFCPCYVF